MERLYRTLPRVITFSVDEGLECLAANESKTKMLQLGLISDRYHLLHPTSV